MEDRKMIRDTLIKEGIKALMWLVAMIILGLLAKWRWVDPVVSSIIAQNRADQPIKKADQTRTNLMVLEASAGNAKVEAIQKKDTALTQAITMLEDSTKKTSAKVASQLAIVDSVRAKPEIILKPLIADSVNRMLIKSEADVNALKMLYLEKGFEAVAEGPTLQLF